MPYYKRDLNLPAKEALLNEVVEVVIENEFLRVRISAKGAEMQSIEQKGAGWTDASSEVIAAGEAGLPTSKAERMPQMRKRGLSACGAPTLPFGEGMRRFSFR